MPDVSWGELLVVGIVALVVIGPKDLPRVMRTCGQWMRKLRGLAADFQGQMAMIDRELELEDLRKQLREMRDPELEQQIEKVMSQDRPVRPPAPITTAQWAGSAAGVEEDELLPADAEALRAIDAERAVDQAFAPAAAAAPPVADAAAEADTNLESALDLGADDFLAGEPARPVAAGPQAAPAAESEAEARAEAEAETEAAGSADAAARQKVGGGDSA
jgi:sec-independent protein translocase protein TatB